MSKRRRTSTPPNKGGLGLDETQGDSRQKEANISTSGLLAQHATQADDRGKSEERRQFVLDCFNDVRGLLQLRRHWIAAHVFAEAINRRFDIKDEDKKVTAPELNRVVMDEDGFGQHMTDEGNEFGIFTQKKKMVDLEKNDGERTDFCFHWVGSCGKFPPTHHKWDKHLNKQSFHMKNVKKQDEEKKNRQQ